MRRTYESRRSTLVAALRTHLGSALSFEVPSGGVALWARVAPDIDVDRWVERALSLKVAFAPGSEFAFDRKPRPNARLVFSRQTEAELQDAVRRMAAALRATKAGSFKAASPKAV
jgi:GntR family transcriptional regulator / MocR family aminotransferase